MASHLTKTHLLSFLHVRLEQPALVLASAFLQLGGLLFCLFILVGFSTPVLRAQQTPQPQSVPSVAAQPKGLPQTLPPTLTVSPRAVNTPSPTPTPHPNQVPQGNPDAPLVDPMVNRANMQVDVIRINNRPTLRAIDIPYGMYCLADLPPPNATIVWTCVALRPNR